jgi:hypothetical protein
MKQRDNFVWLSGCHVVDYFYVDTHMQITYSDETKETVNFETQWPGPFWLSQSFSLSDL